jgi:hypothetical protein
LEEETPVAIADQDRRRQALGGGVLGRRHSVGGSALFGHRISPGRTPQSSTRERCPDYRMTNERCNQLQARERDDAQIDALDLDLLGSVSLEVENGRSRNGGVRNEVCRFTAIRMMNQ